MAPTTSAVSRKGRTQAERTELTRKKLIGATIELLKKRRYVGLRTAEVAALAGVSRGAQSHHFPSKDALVLSALEEVYQNLASATEARIRRASGHPTELMDLLLKDGVDAFFGEDFLLALDLMMVDPESALGTSVKKLALQYRKPAEEAWLAAFVEAGFSAEKAENVVRLTFAAARGFGIRKLIGESMDDISHWMSAWTEIAEILLMDTEKA